MNLRSSDFRPKKSTHLGKENPSQDGGMDKASGQAELAKLGAKISELQELLYAAGKHSLLVVFQGRDTAGKDGGINRLLEFLNVQGVNVAAFKVPTVTELKHDFLWRIHQQTPGKGEVGIFNRSHYEDVLVVRVHNLVPKDVWKNRYEQINAFEAELASEGTIVVKFFLNISKDEQEKRLLAREEDATKAWKLSVGDWKEREFWDEYTNANEDAIKNCDKDHAPWYIIPANHKWFRDLAIATILVETLEQYRDQWMDHLKQVGEKAKAELAAYRASLKT